ncbi:MAG: AMP-binding protein [bacterium]|nr:AMP-binding protein [bacterium]
MFLKDHNKTAIAWKEQQISYDELLRQANYYSQMYKEDTVARVAIFAENRPEWAYAFYSAWYNDCTVIPIDCMSTADEVRYILEDCKPDVVFCTEDGSDVMDEARKQLKFEPRFFNLDEIAPMGEDIQQAVFTDPDLQKTAVIIYTSGTTGSPKGVMLSYDNILANIESVTEYVEVYAPDRNTLVLLPLHHVFPLVGSMVAPLFVGATSAFCPSLSAPDIMETLQKNKIAIIIGVPRFYNMLIKGIRDKINAKGITRMLFKLARKVNSMGFSRKLFKTVHDKFGGHVMFMVVGGAKCDEITGRDFRTLGFEMLEGFGMTEAAPMICFTRPGRVRIGSAGEPMPQLEVTSKDGEIIAKGRNIMKGYFNRKEETDEVIKDGWLHTGDLGHFDDEGFVHITGRKKEIIVLSNGKNINPEELESHIASISDLVGEIAVYMKDDSLQAAIYPDFKKVKEKRIHNLGEILRNEVIDKFNQKVSSYKRINKFILMKEELPKTRLGKIQRFKLAEISAETQKKEVKDEPKFEEYLVIKEFLQKQTDLEVHPDDDFEIDLGMDSLDKVSFQTFLQATFGVETKDDLFLQYPTLEKLSRYIKETKVKFTVEAVKWAEIFKEKIELTLPKAWFTTNLIKNTSRVILKLYFRLKGEGTEKLPKGPFIIAPNHQSYFDGLFVAIFLKNRLMRRTYFSAKEKHVRKKWVKFIANRNNVIVMDINNDLKLSLQKMAEVLKEGKNLIIFPEGTRSNDGNMGKFKKTFAILSRELNIPIVPVSIKGAYEAMPRDKVFPRPWKKINIRFLDPVYPGEHTYESLMSAVQDSIKLDMAPPQGVG